MRLHMAILALPVAAVGLAACGSSGDTSKLEPKVAALLGQRGYPGSKVDCPDTVDVKKGNTFECTVTGSDIASVTIRIDDNDGNSVTLVKATPK